MSFNPANRSISGSDDASISNPNDSHFLKYDLASQKWTNLSPGIANVTNLQTTLDGKVGKSETYSSVPAGDYLRIINLNYATSTNNPNVERIKVNGFDASWRNEWGALRGTSPYSDGYGDSLVRAIRTDSDGITRGNALELVDRRAGANGNQMWGRSWLDGSLTRNGNVMADVYVMANGATPPATLPAGTVIIELS